MNPLVSVVVTTYNQELYIERALKSVFDQTFVDFELVVVDDGSTDETPERIAKFRDRIRYVGQSNKGVAASRNTGVCQARGELVAFLDGDDIWEPEKLDIQVAAAQTHPNSGLIVVDGIKFSDEGLLRDTLLGNVSRDLRVSRKDLVASARCYERLLRGNFISTTSQVMVPAKVLQAVGPSDTELRLASDYDLYLRIAAKYDCTFVLQKLIGWRFHADSASGPEDIRDLRWNEHSIRVLKKELRRAPAEHHPLIRQAISRRVLAAAQGAYYFGREVNRLRATAYLLRLLVKNLGHLSVVAFLSGLWCSPALARGLGPAVRNLLQARGCPSDFSREGVAPRRREDEFHSRTEVREP